MAVVAQALPVALDVLAPVPQRSLVIDLRRGDDPAKRPALHAQRVTLEVAPTDALQLPTPDAMRLGRRAGQRHDRRRRRQASAQGRHAAKARRATFDGYFGWGR